MKGTIDDDERVWRALVDPARRGILDALAARAMTTGELVALLPRLCRTAVMKHLDVLDAAGLVVVRRDGRQRWNYLNPVPIDRVCRRWTDRHTRRMSAALNRLKDVVEAGVVGKSKPRTEKTRR